MKAAIVVIVCEALICAQDFAENPRWREVGTSIPARADLDVRWDVSIAKFPQEVWVYRLLPYRFAPATIDNLVKLCALSDKAQKRETADGVTYHSSDGKRTLLVSLSGSVHYDEAERHYGPTNLAEGVPKMGDLPRLATAFLNELNISLSDVTGYADGEKFNCWEPLTEYYVNNLAITNIEFRGVNFRRAVDGIPVVGGDGGRLYYGENSKICKVSLAWHRLERVKAYSTVTKRTVSEFLQQGKARQGLLSDNAWPINWAKVKRVTIKKALPCYFAGKTDMLYPFVALATSVETEQGSEDVEIDCPIIDEAKL